MDRKRLFVVAFALIGLAAGSSATAHTGWSIQGSIRAAARTNCGTSPSCQAWFLASCNAALMSADGNDVSIVALPEGVAGHRVKITWTSAAGPLGEVYIQQYGPQADGRCSPLSPDTQAFVSGHAFSIQTRTQYLVVTASTAVQLNWKIEGVLH